MTTPATNSPICPRLRCGGPLVTYDAHGESLDRDVLRCAACGQQTLGTPDQVAQARAADAAHEADLLRPAAAREPEDVAPRLYRAFADARNWTDADGMKMNPWSRLMDGERRCWAAVAREAAQTFRETTC
jgi:hypothetical protein